MIRTLEELQALGVQFVATRDNVDYTTPTGRLFVQVLGCLAEFEKSLLVERTKMGLEHARRNGKVLGRPSVRNDMAITELRTKGLSIRKIAKELKISVGSIQRSLKTLSI